MRRKRVLFTSQYPPEPDHDSGSKRMLDMIELMRADQWSVTFAACQGIKDTRYVRMLQQKGVAVYDCSKSRYEDLLERGCFDLAILAFWSVAEICTSTIRRVSPHTRVIVDSVDLNFVRNARRLFGIPAKEHGVRRLDSAYGLELVRELNAYASADRVLTVSQKEAGLISDLIPESGLAEWLPDMEDYPDLTIPLAKRCGIVFVGSFRHEPNIGAVEFLFEEVLPLLDPALLRQHPVYVIGDSLNETVRQLGDSHPHVRMVGWVPCVKPYLEQARISVVPLRYGAGTKRKLLQSLMLGTPAVSTRIGVEGFGLTEEKHVLVADEPQAFAHAIERLLTDESLWLRLSSLGRKRVAASHSHEAVQVRWRKIVGAITGAKPKLLYAGERSEKRRPGRLDLQCYQKLQCDIRQVVKSCVPSDAVVIVASKGDDELLKLAGRTVWHFPQTIDGKYAGHHPKDSSEAIAQLEVLRARGGKYLVLPSTMFWWLEHYQDLAKHLGRHSRIVFRQPELCAVYELLDHGENPRPAVVPRLSGSLQVTSEFFLHERNRCCALLTVADWDTLRQWRECVESHAAYCRKFGHRWIVVSSPLSCRPDLSWRDWSWQKIYAMRQAMERLPDGACLLLVDADVLIAHNAPDWTAERWANPETTMPFLFMARGHSGRFNAGVQMYRNGPDARSFLSTLIYLHQNPNVAPPGCPPVPRELQSFFLAENGPIIHLTSCRPEVIKEVSPKWNNTSDPRATDYLRHFTGPMKPEFRSISRQRPVALVVLNTPWHFECVAPWIYYLVQLGFMVHIDLLHIRDNPDHLAALETLRYAGPFTEQVSLFEAYTISDGKWAQRYLRLKSDLAPPARDYSLLVVLSHYAYWSRPFSKEDESTIATKLRPNGLKQLAIVLYCHTTVAPAGRRNTLVDEVSRRDSNEDDLLYTVCSTTRHGLNALQQEVAAAKLNAGCFVPLYARLWTSTLQEDRRRWQNRTRVRFIVQGRLLPGHRAYRKLAQAIIALPEHLREAVVFSIIGYGDASKVREDLQQAGLDWNNPCIEILPNLSTKRFDDQFTEAHVLFDCLDEAILEREQYLVDRLTSTITRGLPLAKPLLCHAEIAETYSLPNETCETYSDDPQSLAAAIARMVHYTDAEYERKCFAMRRFCLRMHEENLESLYALLHKRVDRLPSPSPSVHPFDDALWITESESLEPNSNCPDYSVGRNGNPTGDTQRKPYSGGCVSRNFLNGTEVKVITPHVEA